MTTYHVFFSQPMYGFNNKEINEKRKKVINKITQCLGKNVEIIPVNRIVRSYVPQNAGRLWYLGEAIKDIERCDFVVFCDGWEIANGCQIEMMIVQQYNIPRITECLINGHSIHDFNKETFARFLSNYDWRRKE